jgi:hypothetical protein
VSPRRRRADAQPPRPPLIAPTPPAAAAPDTGEVVQSITLALEAAKRTRRHMTLLTVALVPGGRDPAADLDELIAVVRRTIRAGDGVWRDGASGLAILLADVDAATSEPVLARMRLRMKGGPGRVRMGRATAAPGIAAADLLELAHFDRDSG